MNFKVIIDQHFSGLTLDSALSPIDNKWVLSLVNDFEDGSWRFNRFQKFVWNNIKETALSYRERQALIKEGEDSVLTEAAKNLRFSQSDSDISRGSEIAEIVLYGLMKHHYNALPVVPKIFYKQNSQDNAKGADSVHIVVSDDEDFTIWFGESKFYNSIENARLDKILDSVKESLSSTKLRKENSIITNVSDLDSFDEISNNLKERIKESLKPDSSLDGIKPSLHIPILLLYECHITKDQDSLSQDYKDEIFQYHQERATAYFKKQIAKLDDVHLYEVISFHLILFPVPQKDKIIDKFINKAKVYRD